MTTLTLGGAEMMLWKLLSRLDRNAFEPSVLALAPETDRILDAFREIDVSCKLLCMPRGMGAALRLPELVRSVRSTRPDLLQGWMYHGNLAATFASAFVRPRVPVLWNIRGSLIDPAHDKRSTVMAIRLGGWLSFAPEKIVNNSEVSASEHERLFRYRSRNRVIVPNGFDTGIFRPSSSARLVLRETIGINPDAVLVGMIARYHPMKDHANFIRAAAMLRAREPAVHYVLAGEWIDDANVELTQLIEQQGLADRVHLLGFGKDIPSITAALDVAVSASSSGEGFPNVVGEAMSCGVPCVVTNVGDSAHVVGDTGRVVQPRDSAALAAAIEDLITLSPRARASLGEKARQRIVDRFSLDAVVRQYEQLYTGLCRHAHAA